MAIFWLVIREKFTLLRGLGHHGYSVMLVEQAESWKLPFA